MSFVDVFKAVLILMFSLAVLSQVMPPLNEALQETENEIASTDETGITGEAVNIAHAVPNPKSTLNQKIGELFFWLLEKHPVVFFILGAIIAVLLIYFGVAVSSINNW